ncbi:hypothetical protein GUJ93_ZPchr0005g15604 [Zizania palustris]|uniref:UV radiation resistance-associated gene protein n=1 Tax=Zizania palustris TaxID=103762 RepID=A0A8J5S3P6_ZIZPA|nr:hypothetical protein GUJ93_ZPchr0005g15604 [Zizania palustris]
MSPEAAGVGVGRSGPGVGAAAVAWPELRGQIGRAGSLAESLAAAAEARTALARRLEAALEVRKESLRQGAALDEMRNRLELRRSRVEEVLVAKRDALQGVERRKEQLQAQIDRVLQLSGAVAAANRQVQEAKEVLSGAMSRLVDLQRRLRVRRQCMIGQVAALYPVKVFHDLPHAENLGAYTHGAHGGLSEENGTLPEENGTHVLNVIKFPQVHALSFLSWQIKQSRKQKDCTEKELQRSAAVLGYAAHAVLLIASYLDVPLRYPLHFGGSRSYASDCLPSAETASIASTECTFVNMTDSKLTKYPLFLECQEDESTKASYAIYLLHKDTEQLLNYIGAESSGRRVFGNLQELIRIIQSDEYVCRVSILR